MSFEDFQNNITNHIKAHGLSVVGVPGQNGPSFAYSIGLSLKYGFELLTVGLPVQHAQTIFNQIAAAETPPALDVPVIGFSNLPLMFKRCDRDLQVLRDEYVCQADRYFDRPVDVVQMVLSDRKGRFPGDPAYDGAHMDRLQRLFFEPSPAPMSSKKQRP